MNTYLDLFGLMAFNRILSNKNLYKIFDSVCNNPNQKRFKNETIFTIIENIFDSDNILRSYYV